MESTQQQPKFKTTQDFELYLISRANKGSPLNGEDLLRLRTDCYRKIEQIRKRPLIVYASKFWDIPQNAPVSIELADIEIFVDLVNSVPPGEKEVDVLIHSPGGSPDATERIVEVLRSRFEKVHFLIPHSAYSAATMLALSGNSIVLYPTATLGPIDPQINGTPARSIQRGFEKIKQIIKTEGVESLPAYVPLLEQYSLALLEVCEDAQKLSKELVSQWLQEYMFENDGAFANVISTAADFFSDYDTQLLHSRPLMFKKIRKLGLRVDIAAGDLKDLLWEAFVLINGAFRTTPLIKLYENTHGITFGRGLSASQAQQS